LVGMNNALRDRKKRMQQKWLDWNPY
jgi:hypothetical protein